MLHSEIAFSIKKSAQPVEDFSAKNDSNRRPEVSQGKGMQKMPSAVWVVIHLKWGVSAFWFQHRRHPPSWVSDTEQGIMVPVIAEGYNLGQSGKPYLKVHICKDLCVYAYACAGACVGPETASSPFNSFLLLGQRVTGWGGGGCHHSKHNK